MDIKVHTLPLPPSIHSISINLGDTSNVFVKNTIYSLKPINKDTDYYSLKTSNKKQMIK